MNQRSNHQICRDLFSRTYEVYEFLKLNLIEESDTSMLLHKPDFDFFYKKIFEELNELVNARSSEEVVQEGHQLWYWLCLACVSKGIEYEKIAPHEAVMNGFSGCYQTYFDFPDDEKSIVSLTRFCMQVLGMKCKDFNIHPYEIAEYDLNEMKKRDYLNLCSLE